MICNPNVARVRWCSADIDDITGDGDGVDVGVGVAATPLLDTRRRPLFM